MGALSDPRFHERRGWRDLARAGMLLDRQNFESIRDLFMILSRPETQAVNIKLARVRLSSLWSLKAVFEIRPRVRFGQSVRVNSG